VSATAGTIERPRRTQEKRGRPPVGRCSTRRWRARSRMLLGEDDKARACVGVDQLPPASASHQRSADGPPPLDKRQRSHMSTASADPLTSRSEPWPSDGAVTVLLPVSDRSSTGLGASMGFLAALEATSAPGSDYCFDRSLARSVQPLDARFVARSRTLSRFTPSTRLHAGAVWATPAQLWGTRVLGCTGRCGVASNANTPAIADEAAASGRGWMPLVVGDGVTFSGRELLVWLCGQPCRPRRSSCDVAQRRNV
jgi:hypothetical protein